MLGTRAPQAIKVRKRTKIRNQYNQAPHLTQDSNVKVTTSQLDITNESQVSPFPAGDHKASINRHMRKHNKNKTLIPLLFQWYTNENTSDFTTGINVSLLYIFQWKYQCISIHFISLLSPSTVFFLNIKTQLKSH